MKLGRMLLTAPKRIAALALITLTLASSACNFAPPSATNPPAAQSATPMTLATRPPGRTPQPLETPLATAAGSTPTARVSAQPAQQPALVFQWRGGLVGRNDLWEIYANGSIRNNRDQQFQVSPETVAALMAQLETLGVYDLQDRYEATCNDCFEYTLYAYRAGQRKTIYAIDNGALPDALVQAVKAIQEVVAPTI